MSLSLALKYWPQLWGNCTLRCSQSLLVLTIRKAMACPTKMTNSRAPSPSKPQRPSKSCPTLPAEKPQGPPPSPSPPYPFTREIHVTEGVKATKKIKGLADQPKGGMPSNK
ncbi:hypothetical protein PoB_005785500 [Plakobranchus ocellatus]|uniref:Uncharacterized protein n=1 Tax=Plakobranchus ocellatus TaxID=259542 RepID=A0AAV4CIE2_9GAST|nr:hypothetical protein PoB_005785500 [Plakobranchus ocellatus]